MDSLPINPKPIPLSNSPAQGVEGIRSGETRSRILQAARCEFIARGLAGARMRSIAQAAEVNGASLHYHFGGKQDLYDTIILEMVESIWGGFMADLNDNFTTNDFRELLKLALRHHLGTLAKNSDFPKLILRELLDGGQHLNRIINQLREKVSPALNRIAQEYAKGVGQGLYRPQAMPQFFLNMAGMSLISVMMISFGDFFGQLLPVPLHSQPDFVETRIESIVNTLLQGCEVIK